MLWWILYVDFGFNKNWNILYSIQQTIFVMSFDYSKFFVNKINSYLLLIYFFFD